MKRGYHTAYIKELANGGYALFGIDNPRGRDEEIRLNEQTYKTEEEAKEALDTEIMARNYSKQWQ